MNKKAKAYRQNLLKRHYIPLSKLPDLLHLMFNTWLMEHENNRLDEVGYFESEGLPVDPDKFLLTAEDVLRIRQKRRKPTKKRV